MLKFLVSQTLKYKQNVEIRLDKDEIANCFLGNLGHKLGLSNLQKKNGISYLSMR